MGGYLTDGSYLAIDESNHGRFPEIFVAVYSEALSDIKRTKREEGIGKRRRNSKVMGQLGPRTYLHLLISESDAMLLGEKNRDTNIKIVAFSELIKKTIEINGSLDAILIDGQGNKSLVDKLRDTLYPIQFPKPSFKKKGDLFYPLINYADGVANVLHKHYSSLGNKPIEERKKYLDTKVSFKIEDYRDLAA